MDSYQAIYDAVRSKIGYGDAGEAIRDVAFRAFDISNAVAILQQEFGIAAAEMQRPSAIYRPRLFPNGNKWCALYGDNLQDGLGAFGDTPAEAMSAFDEAFRTEHCGKAA